MSSEPTSMKLSISIVIYDLHDAQFRRCLQSLAESLGFAIAAGVLNEFEIQLIDNGMNACQLGDIIEDSGLNAILIKNDKNLGFGAGHNQSIRTAKSDVHLVANPDLEFTTQTILELVGALRDSPDAVIVGPMGFSTEGENGYLAKRQPSLFALVLRGLAPEWAKRRYYSILQHYEYHDLRAAKEPTEVELLSGCCMLARTKPLQEIAGFNEKFFLYFEDFDLCCRIRHLGKVVYVPTALVTHHGGHTARKGLTHIAQFCLSGYKFFRLYGWVIR